MTQFRLSPEAESELDQIWLYIAEANGSIDRANRTIDDIFDRFWILARHPYLGRPRDHDLRQNLRSLAVDEYVVFYRIDDDATVLILHVIHGKRDIESLIASQPTGL